MPLGKGKTGWFFSDTFLGTVNPDGSRPTDSPFVNNSVVVQDRRGDLTTITGGTPDDPAGIIPPEPDGKWYWIGDPTPGRHGTVQVPLLQFARTGTGQWDFAWTANRLATLDGQTLQLEGIVDLPRRPASTGARGPSKNAARPTSTASPTPAECARPTSPRCRARTASRARGRIGTARPGRRTKRMPYPWCPTSPTSSASPPFRDGYLLVTQDTSELFSTRIVARTSCSPTGPFTDPVELYRTPETGALGSYGDPDVFTYNAHEHPNLRQGNRILVSYNVNTFDNVGDVYDDASIYRPRFIDVQLKVTG